MGEPQPPQLGIESWDMGARNWTDVEAHPIIPKNRETPRKRAILDRLSRFIPQLQAAKNILDIGSGGGTHFYLPEALSSKVIAIDGSTEMLKRNSAAHKIQADVRKPLPIADSSVEAVTQFFLNRYLTPEEQAQELTEIARVLKTNGKVLIMDHTTILGQMQEVAKFDPEVLKNTPAGAQFDWTLEEVVPTNEINGTIRQGPLYLLSGVKK